MADTTKKTFVVTTADRKEIEIKGTHLIEDETSAKMSIYDGDTLVGSFRGASSVYVQG